MRYVRLVNDVVAVHRPVSRHDVGYLPGIRRCRSSARSWILRTTAHDIRAVVSRSHGPYERPPRRLRLRGRVLVPLPHGAVDVPAGRFSAYVVSVVRRQRVARLPTAAMSITCPPRQTQRTTGDDDIDLT